MTAMLRVLPMQRYRSTATRLMEAEERKTAPDWILLNTLHNHACIKRHCSQIFGLALYKIMNNYEYENTEQMIYEIKYSQNGNIVTNNNIFLEQHILIWREKEILCKICSSENNFLGLHFQVQTNSKSAKILSDTDLIFTICWPSGQDW